MKQKLLVIFFAIIFLTPSEFSSKGFGVGSVFSWKQDSNVVVIYPNPARDYIVVKTNKPLLKIKSLTFYSIIGTQVLEVKLNANVAEVKIDHLKSGKYLIKYSLSDGKQGVTKIIKQ